MRVTPRHLPLLAAVSAALILPACGGDDDAADDAAQDAVDDAAEQVDRAIEENAPGGTLPDDVDDEIEEAVEQATDDAERVTIPPAIEEALGGSLPDDVEDLLPGGSLPEDPDDLLPGGSVPDLTLPDMPEAGGGSCSVQVTGDVQAEWSEEQNVGSASVSYWYGEQEREFMGDDFVFLTNCSAAGGDGLSIYSSNGVTPEQVPMAPGEYPLVADSGMMGGLQDNGDFFIVLLNLTRTQTNWGIAEPGGMLTISEFDDEHLAMTIDAPIYDSLAEMTGTPAQAATLHAEFMLNNPNS